MTNIAIPDLTNAQLLSRYRLATKWTSDRMQVTGTDKNKLGERYNHEEFMVALTKIELMEEEIQKRRLTIS